MKTNNKLTLIATAVLLAVIYCGLWYLAFGKNMGFPIITSIPLSLVIASSLLKGEVNNTKQMHGTTL